MTRLVIYLGLLWAKQDVRRRALLMAVFVAVCLIAFAEKADAAVYCCRDWSRWTCETFGIC